MNIAIAGSSLSRQAKDMMTLMLEYERNEKRCIKKEMSILCHNEGCPSVINNKLMYFDDDHLSIDGAMILLERYFEN